MENIRAIPDLPENRAFVRACVRKVASRTGLSRDDREDLEQELLLKVVAALPDYDPSRGTLHGFVAAVVRHRCTSVFRERLAQKRDPRRCCSLHQPTPCDEGEVEQLLNQVGAQEPDTRRERCWRTHLEEQERALDLREALARMPARLREAAEALMTAGPSDAARKLGVSRSAFNKRMQEVRRILVERGFGK